ncbi:PREDICTED: G-type lectin S-receptor [Prunus dulcis]|uniref:PREDICTED: G-type lectin S-receptor n=1 Tax=Prunus dulcis TaxID=3755 RepID=A0A5E4F9L1_PRUDU|nr:PREDICTED: G-type lectin S-receptor [Prunus dulcis]
MKSKQREEGEGGAGKKMISVSAVTDQAGMQDLGANAGDFDDDEGGGLGTLKDGQEIAVKRLSTHSRQGLNELKNEAWMLYTEGRSIEVLDTSVGDSSDLHEVVRSIHVGLSSVQRNPADRPSMPSCSCNAEW